MVGSIVGMQSSEILQVASEYEVKVLYVILSLTADFNLSLSSLFSLFSLSFSLFLSLYLSFSLSLPPSLPSVLI